MLHRNQRFYRFICTALVLCLVLGVTGTVFAEESAGAGDAKVVRIAFADPPTLKIGDMEIYHPSYAGMLAFKGSLEKATGGKYRVELYPNGVLGDVSSTLEQIISGTLEGSMPGDGALAAFYPDLQVFNIPYLFNSVTAAYDVLDSQWCQELFDDMAKQSGLRIICSYDNGGYRHFTNSAREIKTASDMAGLNIRVMDSPVYLNMVKAMGASATPVAWLELYSALQTGVVDGEENSAVTILGASLEEVQPYCTLDGHLLGLAFMTFSEEWLQNLDEETRGYVMAAGREASIAARGTCRYAEALAIQTLQDKGVKVYSPTEEELETFKVAQQPVIDYLKETVDAGKVDELLNVVSAIESGAAPVSSGEPAPSPSSTQPAASGAADNQKAPVDSAASSGGNTVYVIIAGICVLLVVAFVFTRKKKKSDQ